MRQWVPSLVPCCHLQPVSKLWTVATRVDYLYRSHRGGLLITGRQLKCDLIKAKNGVNHQTNKYSNENSNMSAMNICVYIYGSTSKILLNGREFTLGSSRLPPPLKRRLKNDFLRETKERSPPLSFLYISLISIPPRPALSRKDLYTLKTWSWLSPHINKGYINKPTPCSLSKYLLLCSCPVIISHNKQNLQYTRYANFKLFIQHQVTNYHISCSCGFLLTNLHLSWHVHNASKIIFQNLYFHRYACVIGLHVIMHALCIRHPHYILHHIFIKP